MRLKPNVSSLPLKDIDTIQKSGATAVKASISPTRCRASRVGFRAAESSCMEARSASFIVEPPSPRQHEHQHSDEHQHDYHDRGHSRRVAVFIEQKSLLVDIENGERGRIGGPSPCHHIDEVESLRTAYGGDGRHE